MLEDVAERVLQELEGEGYEPRMHEPDDNGGVFEIRLPPSGYDLADLRTLVLVAEDNGIGLRLGADGSIKLGG